MKPCTDKCVRENSVQEIFEIFEASKYSKNLLSVATATGFDKVTSSCGIGGGMVYRAATLSFQFFLF